jgi:AraC family transcriptional regulator, arabinose operon regulatory protein
MEGVCSHREHYVKARDRARQEVIKYTNPDLPVSVNQTVRPAGSAHGSLAFHDDYELHFIRAGAGSYFIRDKKFEFSKNHVIFIPPGAPHRCTSDPGHGYEKLSLMFFRRLFSGKKADRLFGSSLPRRMDLTEEEATEVEVLLRSIRRELSSAQALYRELIRTEIEKFSLLLRRAAERTGSHARNHHPAVGKVCEIIEARFREDLALADIADEVGYSTYYVSRIFKECAGVGPKQYILERRIAESKRILRERDDLSVEAVGMEVGFHDFAIFNRSFKKIAGLTPSAYRKISQ